MQKLYNIDKLLYRIYMVKGEEKVKAIINGKIITKEKVIEGKVLVFNDRIVDILDKEQLKQIEESDSLEIIDAEGNYISPGFIDLHIHGSGGKDTMDGDVEALRTISRTIAQNGVTAFLPTTMTMHKHKIYRALDNIKQAMKIDFNGAKVLGAHMEGPFINERFKGAQSEEFIEKPNYKFLEGYEYVVKIITLAPEKDEEFEFVKKVRENTEIILSIGHSNATYEQAIEAIENGVSHATHTFNAMTPLNHRQPGIVGAIFNSDISCELIADNIHVHPGAYRILINGKNKEKVILITDSMRAGGMKDGIWELGGQKVIVDNGAARLEDGTLAGSVLTLNKAVKNILENTSLNICEVVAMASLNPAKELKIDNIKGSIEKGKDADIVIFDNDLNVRFTIVEGKIAYRNEELFQVKA